MARSQIPPQQGNMIVGGTDTYIAGEKLQQVDVPVETLLGAANGAFKGAMLSGGVSALVTIAEHGARGASKLIMQNIKGNHLFGILGGTAAFAFLGGLVRYSRASKHNEWSERHYAFLEEKNHAERIQAESENDSPTQGAKR